MKQILAVLIVLAIVSIILLGCTPDETVIEEEMIETQPQEEAEVTEQVSEETVEDEQAEEQEQINESEGKTPVITIDLAEDADKTAKLFADKWEEKQYSIMYTMFTPALKEKKTADEFVAIMELDPFYKKINSVEADVGTIDANEVAKLSLTAMTNVQTIDIPSARLSLIDGQWRVSALVDVFDLETYDAACSGYRHSSSYTMEDCAYDFAKKMKNASFCDISECHYVQCLKDLGKTAGMMQEAQQCYYCQPPMKTIHDCILDIAIKHDKPGACDIIDEEKYSDKYCKCLGRFANHKQDIKYCDSAPDHHKDICLTGYEGGLC